MDSLILKVGTIVLASIRTVNKRTNIPLIIILHENAVRFEGYQNGEVYFEIAKPSECYLTTDILNNSKDKINQIDLLRPFETILIESNEILGCAMVLEAYITEKGEHLLFRDEKSRCFGVIKIGFDRVFGATSLWEIGDWEYPNSKIKTCGRRTETDGGLDRDGICNTSRALPMAGRNLEKVRFKETTTSENFYASIRYDFGIIYSDEVYKQLFRYDPFLNVIKKNFKYFCDILV
jgi:hypothetical protein